MTKSLKELRDAKRSKPKHLSNSDFNATYNALRNGEKHPEVKKNQGQTFGQKSWLES